MCRNKLAACCYEEPPTMWGQHLIIDLARGRREAIRSRETIARFARELVAAIHMKAYGDPILAHFAEHSPKAAGWTLVQLIETSSITGHFCDLSGDAYLDVFSCQEFDVQTVIDLVEETFEPEHVQTTVLMRQAGQGVTELA
jgi:S-adenosylmethionine/arginine decarboxylase-like enzyme